MWETDIAKKSIVAEKNHIIELQTQWNEERNKLKQMKFEVSRKLNKR